MRQSPRYWEKTVEYAFVLEASNVAKVDFIAPLSGKEEHAAGDAIFGKDDTLILVEFKVDETKLSSEKELFKNYSDAEDQMSGRDGHHFLVYAGSTPGVGQPLPPLAAQTYFSSETVSSVAECLTRGLDPEIFKEYVAELFDLKHADGRSTSGQICPDTLANVVGVRANSKKVSTVTLYEYAREMFPELEFAQSFRRAPHTGYTPTP